MLSPKPGGETVVDFCTCNTWPNKHDSCYVGCIELKICTSGFTLA